MKTHFTYEAWLTDENEVEHFASLDCLVGKPEPGWPGDLERRELYVDGELKDMRDPKWRAVADRVLENQ